MVAQVAESRETLPTRIDALRGEIHQGECVTLRGKELGPASVTGGNLQNVTRWEIGADPRQDRLAPLRPRASPGGRPLVTLGFPGLGVGPGTKILLESWHL